MLGKETFPRLPTEVELMIYDASGNSAGQLPWGGGEGGALTSKSFIRIRIGGGLLNLNT